MVGPVLYHEMLLGARRNRGYVFRWFYAGWIFLQLFGMLFFAWAQATSTRRGFTVVSFADFASALFVTLVTQHFIILLVTTPVLTAGAITDEKWRGTLQYLLVTELFSWEILVGKLIARLYQALLIALVPLPLICFLGVFGGLDLLMLVTLAASSVVMAFSIGSMSLLASVLCRHTRDAVLGLYAVGGLLLLAINLGRSLLNNLFAGAGTTWFALFDAILECLDPLHPMGTGWSLDDPNERARRLLASVLAWGVLGLFCLTLATLRLRSSYLRYLERSTAHRWWPVLLVASAVWLAAGVAALAAYLAVDGTLLDYLGGTGPVSFAVVARFLGVWAIAGLVLQALFVGVLSFTGRAGPFLDRLHRSLQRSWLTRRASIDGDPLRWKERHVEGIAPLAILRATPRWLGIALILLFTTGVCIGILAKHLIPPHTLGSVIAMGLQVDLDGLLAVRNGMLKSDSAFFYQGMVVLMLAGLVVGIRCSGAVTGEREKNTWEALLLTPLDTKQLIRSKLWGIIGASLPYLMAYTVPTLFFSALGGLGPFLWTCLWLVVMLLGMAFVGSAGLWCSVRSKSSWRSLLGTLGLTYVGGFFLFWVMSPLVGMLALILFIGLMIIDGIMGTKTAPSVFELANIFFILTCVTFALMFVLSAWRFIVSAEYRVSILERTKHWREEEKHPRWSRYGRERRRARVRDEALDDF